MLKRYTCLTFKGFLEFVTLAVVAAVAKSVHRSDAQRDEVVEDRSSGPGTASHFENVVNGKAGLDREFSLARVNHQVAVEEEVSGHADPERGITRGDGREPLGVHDSLSLL